MQSRKNYDAGGNEYLTSLPPATLLIILDSPKSWISSNRSQPF